MKHDEEVASLQSAAAAAEVQAEARVAALTQQLEQALAAHKEATAAGRQDAHPALAPAMVTVRVDIICHFKPCMTEIYLQI